MTPRLTRKFRRLFGLLLLLGALFPVVVPCGALGYTCMPAPDPQGYVQLYYEVEPLTVVLLEGILQHDLPLAYFHGYMQKQVLPPPSRTPTR